MTWSGENGFDIYRSELEPEVESLEVRHVCDNVVA